MKRHRKTHRQTHIGQQHRARGRDPLSLPLLWNKGHLTKWHPPFPRLGLRRGGLLPTEPAAFQHACWPRPYDGWNGQSIPSWKAFPHARHLPGFYQGLRFTLAFPDLPEHRCYYLSFIPFVPKSILPWSRDPGRAPKCSAHSPNPRLGKKTPQDNAT